MFFNALLLEAIALFNHSNNHTINAILLRYVLEELKHFSPNDRLCDLHLENL